MKMKNQHVCLQKESQTLYQIGLFASMNHVSIKTLRYYDEHDLLKPAYVHQDNGYRFYAAHQIADLHQIIALKEIGLSLEKIKNIQKGDIQKNILQKRKQQIVHEIAKLTRQLSQVESYLFYEEEDLSLPVIIKPLPEVKVAYKEQVIDCYDDLFSLMPEMGLEMEEIGCECAQPDYCFTEYLDDHYKNEEIAVDICQSVTEIKESSSSLQFKVIPYVKDAACLFHKGAYHTFPQSYAKILRFIDENGYQINGNIREVYIDGVWNKKNEEEWLSQIQIPICKKICI